ncbi:uncharacterized protein LOC128034026 [Gossypium raimondii]|uniref:uncharacterized protein LOC128034026 n=1 Tax=Gossypium raimondii TaxID=29730 RepID=UPI00227BE6F3|nr:uncharacterized protein LOC128034026 [Gossypium raimondii]
MSQLAQLLADKGKSPVINSGVDQEDPVYPPGFTLTSTQAQLEMCPQRAPVNIGPQYRVGASASMHFQVGSGSNPGGNPTNPVVPDLDDMVEMEKVRIDLTKQLEDRCRWLEEKFRAMENTDYQCGVDAKDLSLVLDLVLSPKFKMPEFEKYNGTSCPEAHITMFCRRMTGYGNNDQLLIHCFQDSLIGFAAKWYNQLSRANIHSWKDLARAFIKQYNHVTDMTIDRITLQNMEKKQNESFRQYAQRWREVATQVQPPLLEKETTMLFINTLEAPFINHMLGSATMNFSDMVMSGEMIENAIRSGRIDGGVDNRRSIPKKKENEVNHMSTYNKSITVNRPTKVVASQQGSLRQEPGVKPEDVISPKKVHPREFHEGDLTSKKILSKKGL